MIAPSVSGEAIAIDSNGDFVIATPGFGLQRVTPSGSVSTIVRSPAGTGWVGMAIDGMGNFILGDNRQHALWRVGPGGSPMVKILNYPVSNTSEWEDVKILVESKGNYILGVDNNFQVRMWSVTPGGVMTAIPLTGGDVPQGISGLAYDANGNYMLLDFRKKTLYRVGPGGAASVVLHDSTRLCCNAVGLHRNPSTGEYVGTLNFTQGVFKISADGLTVTPIAVDAANLPFPEDVVIAAAPVLTPVISAVTSGANFAGGNVISGGSWVSIFGSNLAPLGDSRKWSAATEIVGGRLPMSLDGTSVMVNGKPAVVQFIQPSQVNIQAPDDLAVGPVQVIVTTKEGVSNAFTVNYAKFAPGLFPARGNTLVAQNADNSYVTVYAPARPGETIVIWGTGFGPANPPVPAGMVFAGASPVANEVRVTIGGLDASVEYAGMVGAGLVQLNVRVPPGVSGQVPVIATVGGVSTQSSGNLIAIAN